MTQPTGQALMPPLLAILRQWRGQQGRLLTGLTVALLALSFGLALLSLSALRLAGASAGMLLVSAWALRTTGALRVVLRYGERWLTHDAMFRALSDLRVWFFRRLAAGSAGGLGFFSTGDALSRLVGDVEALDGLYLRLLLPLSAALLILPVLAVLIGRSAPGLALIVCILFAIAAFLLPWLAARRSARVGDGLALQVSALRTATLDLATGLREIRAYGAEARMLEAVTQHEASMMAAQAKLARGGAVAGALAFLCGQAALLSVLAACIGLGLPHMPAIAAILFLFLLAAAFEASSGLVRAGVLTGHMAQSARRLLTIHPDAPQASQAPRRASPIGMSVQFEQVCFAWRSDRHGDRVRLVFDHLSLSIPQGARIGLLGASGSGKSTLAALLLRTVTPQAGRITLGGVGLHELDEEFLRSSIAWLGQSSHLFDDSIRNNLLLGCPDADETALWQALEQAQIAELVRSLPDGLDCWLGEAGTQVSGGQGRRIALARVLLSKAPILILDEPCAGLDSDTERQFLSILNEAVAGRTMILIAHRLTGIEQLDRVWRLLDGQLTIAA